VGLGIAAETLWALSWREIEALEECFDAYRHNQLEMWAASRADMHNAWMTRSDGQRWAAEDFLPSTPQTEARKAGRAGERVRAARDQAEVVMLNARLARMRPGDTEGVPEWALRIK
jgi:hypothetical protein